MENPTINEPDALDYKQLYEEEKKKVEELQEQL